MFSRTATRRRRLAQLGAIFAVGAGIGAAAVALTHHSAGRHVVIEQAPTRTSEVSAPGRPNAAARTAAPASPGSQASFAALQSQLSGRVGLAVAPQGAGPIQTFGRIHVAHAWSTSKVPVLVTLLRHREAANRPLTPSEATDATLAVEQSDNAAIEALFSELEQLDGGLLPASSDVQQTLRTAGDQATVINTAPNDQGFTTYGQTEWSLGGEVTFYRALARGCLLNQRDTSYVVGLMRDIIPSQRWGVGAAGYPSSVPVAFKGGWGPDSAGRYQVRQTAIVGSGGRGYVVTMLALPASGAFSDGIVMIDALARWARAHFNIDAVRPSVACVAAG